MIVSDIIEQAQEQTIRHAASRDFDWPQDGFLALVPIQAGMRNSPSLTVSANRGN